MLPLLALAAALDLQPCDMKVEGRAECGRLEVAENPARPQARRIPLNIVVLRAIGPDRQPDPLYILQGGPGQAVTQLAGFYSRAFAVIRQSRDLILADVRGTGQSNGLPCPLDLHSADLFPAPLIRQCRADLERRADLRQYSTARNVTDIAAILDALGVTQASFYGTSYGTRLGLEFLRRHPARVRTMTLKGIVPPSLLMSDTYSADAAAVAARLLTPDQRAALDRAIAARPARAEGARTLLYSPASAKRLAAIAANPAALDAVVEASRRDWRDGLFLGMTLSVTCAEDIHHLKPRRAEGLGEFRRAQQIAACRDWPRGDVPRDFHQPVHSPIPVLLVSGEYDPVTPPRGGDEVARTLPHSRHIILRDNGHPLGDQAACVVAMMMELLRSASTRGISPTCH